MTLYSVILNAASLTGLDKKNQQSPKLTKYYGIFHAWWKVGGDRVKYRRNSPTGVSHVQLSSSITRNIFCCFIQCISKKSLLLVLFLMTHNDFGPLSKIYNIIMITATVMNAMQHISTKKTAVKNYVHTILL